MLQRLASCNKVPADRTVNGLFSYPSILLGSYVNEASLFIKASGLVVTNILSMASFCLPFSEHIMAAQHLQVGDLTKRSASARHPSSAQQ